MKYIYLLTLFFFTLGSCSSIKVRHKREKNVDFGQFRTFSIYPWDPMNAALVSSPDQEIIIDLISLEMQDRGYKKLEAQGDIIIDLYIILDQRRAATAITNYYNTGYWGGYHYSPWAYGYGNTSFTSFNLTRGTLIISMFSPELKKLVWQGSGQGLVSEDQQVRERNLPEAIGRILFKYPVKKKKK